MLPWRPFHQPRIFVPSLGLVTPKPGICPNRRICHAIANPTVRTESRVVKRTLCVLHRMYLSDAPECIFSRQYSRNLRSCPQMHIVSPKPEMAKRFWSVNTGSLCRFTWVFYKFISQLYHLRFVKFRYLLNQYHPLESIFTACPVNNNCDDSPRWFMVILCARLPDITKSQRL